MGTELDQWWERPFDAQPEPHLAVPLVAVALALVVVFSGSTWRLARQVVTLVHEAGHALAALLSGRRLQAILLHSDTSGLTVSRGRPTGPGMVFTVLAGYPAPALLGLLFAGLIAADRLALVLLLAAFGVLGVLVLVRNAYGVFIVLAAAAVLAAVAFLATANVAAAFVYLLTWVLLLGSVRPVLELPRKRRRRSVHDSDPDQLARLTELPAGLWVLVMATLAVGCLIAGGAWLLEPSLSQLSGN